MQPPAVTGMLSYQYHDALLEQVEFGPGQGVALSFALYPVFYPDAPRVAVRLGGIFNFSAFQRYLAPICTQEADSDDLALGVCETFQVDTKQPSAEKSCYLFIRIQHFGHFRIHCERVTEMLLK